LPSRELKERIDSTEHLTARIAALEAELASAQEVLEAIRQGEVDAVVVRGSAGDQVFTLEGADHPYRVLVEQMREGTLTLHEGGLIVYSNQRFADMVQAPLDAVIGSRITAFLDPEDHSLFAGLIEGSAGSRGEIALRTARGAHVPAYMSLNRLDLGGTPYMTAVVTDLTEQRRNEAIVKEEQLSRRILQQAGEAIVVVDTNGTILRASDAAHVLAGRNVLLQPFDAVFSLMGRAGGPLRSDFLFSSARRGHFLRGVEVSLPRQDSVSALLLSMGALHNADGELSGCVVTLTDITQRKEDEEALARQAQQLERSNNDLRQFAYSASHDLREPLRVVSLYSQLADEKLREKPEEASPFLRQVVRAAQRMETLLRDLLSYVQVGEGLQHSATAVDSMAALERAMAGLQASVVENDAEITFEPLPPVWMHEVHLEQLFQNLISNGLKYRRDVRPAIRISAQRDGGMWRISVADNGIGVPQEYQRQIFGLFNRLHGKDKYSGSGIGLAICQRIVERYGGRIWVESQVGEGSTFHFTVPTVDKEPTGEV
jgi:PAS domain S-box-containing protein